MPLHRIIVTLALGLLAAACSPNLYSPNTQNVLIAPERGDLIVAGMANLSRVEVQTAYAVTDAVAIQLNGGLFPPGEQDNGYGGSGRFLEVGAGFFAPADERLAWEIHALLGVGSVENYSPSAALEQSPTTGKMNADVARVGIQPAIGFRSRFLEAAGSGRLIRLRYRNVEGTLVYEGERQDQRLRDVSHYLLAEPAVTVRAGPDHLKLQLQVARSFNLTNAEFRQDRSMLTVGVVADVPTR